MNIQGCTHIFLPKINWLIGMSFSRFRKNFNIRTEDSTKIKIIIGKPQTLLVTHNPHSADLWVFLARLIVTVKSSSISEIGQMSLPLSSIAYSAMNMNIKIYWIKFYRIVVALILFSCFKVNVVALSLTLLIKWSNWSLFHWH